MAQELTAEAGRGAAWSRPLLWTAAMAAVATAAWLWVVQLVTLSQPCSSPGCVWPRLSAEGFASLAAVDVQPWAWTALIGVLSALWIMVPLILGVIVARATPPARASALLWFVFALGPLSAVPTDPLATAVLRTLSLGAWFCLFATYPTGRFVPRWAMVSPIAALAWTITLSLPPMRRFEALGDPLFSTLTSTVYVVAVGLIVAAQVVQYRRGDRGDRRRIRLLLVGLIPFLALGIAGGILDGVLDRDTLGYGTLGGAILYEVTSFSTVLLIGVVAVATVRHGAYGVRVVINRVLLGTLALGLAALVYGMVVALVSALLSGWLPPAIAAVAAALVLASTYGRLAGAIGRLVYGDADDPATIAAALDQRVAEATSAEDILNGIAASLSQRLRLPGVSITARGAAGHGIAGELVQERAVTVPLALDGRSVGEVTVTLRLGQRRLTRRDRNALGAAAGPLATAATAARLTAQLRASRLEVLVSRDDERRVLRRRLHDELGPTLAITGHRLAAARDDPGQLVAAERTLADAVQQIRSISRELRPPALDELGLRAALLAFADGLSFDLEIDAPDAISPGAIEVTIYRVVVEALLNVERHAHAERAAVEVSSHDDGWLVSVDDDGIGMTSSTMPGVGLQSIRERADELGGSVTFGSSPLGGARVRATVPTGGMVS
jgi:two-component system NarL family sensor kinase